MADIRSFQIINYRVSLEKAVITVQGKNYDRIALINCWGPNRSTDVVRYLNIEFIDTENDVPENITRRVNNQYIVHIIYKSSYYAWFLDLLRNEETTYLEFSPTEPRHNRLTTGSEPIGEGD